MDYQRHYDSLISRARMREHIGYMEKHHIVPRCLGGGDEPGNIARLTPEEHHVAHQLLLKLHPGDEKLVFAAWAMSRGRPGNKRYGWLRRKYAEKIGDYWRGRKRREFSDEHKAKISQGQTGRKRGEHSELHKARLSAAHKGKVLTDEHKQKLSAAKLGKKRDNYPLSTCPHCGVTGGGGSMRRWHFDNCRVNHG